MTRRMARTLAATVLVAASFAGFWTGRATAPEPWDGFCGAGMTANATMTGCEYL